MPRSAARPRPAATSQKLPADVGFDDTGIAPTPAFLVTAGLVVLLLSAVPVAVFLACGNQPGNEARTLLMHTSTVPWVVWLLLSLVVAVAGPDWMWRFKRRGQPLRLWVPAVLGLLNCCAALVAISLLN